MNILVFTSVYPQPDDNGTVVTPTVKYFCEQWAEAGHKVIVIHNNSSFPIVYYAVPKYVIRKMESRLGHNFPRRASRRKFVYSKENITVYRLPMIKAVPHARFSNRTINKQIKKIKMILREEEFVPDIIVSHWVNPQVDLIEKMSQDFNAKKSLVFHGDCSEENIRKFNLINKIKHFDAIGCRNDNYATLVMKMLKLNKKPFICYSGVPDIVAEEQICKITDLKLESSLEFIYVGRLVKYKNVDTIIKALNKKYSNKRYRLHIIGAGSERDGLERLSKKLGCEDRIVFHGQLTRDEAFNIMKKCFCFIMVSDNETFGMVYIEAMLAGCVTIASKNCGVDGVIVDGENGFLSKQGDVEDLIRTLDRIENDSNINNLRVQAIKTAYEYRDSKIAQQYLDDILNWKN